MKIVVFGATGGTGRHLISQAIAAGHIVTGVARDPAAVKERPEGLRVVRGDVTDAESVIDAVEGQDVVLCCVGPRPGVPAGTLISSAARNIREGMIKHRVRRLVFESGLMVGEARGYGMLQRLGISIFRAINSALCNDKRIAERLVTESPFEWVIIRPPTFGEIPGRGTFRLDVDLDGKITKMANADVAAAMLQQATDSRFLSKAVELSY
jgi:uncharacterized protein YbjT (DUF2867 family)